jgi:TolB-like protein
MDVTKVFSEEEISLELKQVLSYSAFKNSPTLTKFLEYVTNETLNKNEKFIKEYTIAINVLNRNSNFNSYKDAVVRIHAGRLRRTLNEYYLTEGINDSLVISIPKGGYIPEFKNPEQIKKNTLDSYILANENPNPTVAIFPFKTDSKRIDIDLFATGLNEELTAELSRFKDISVVGYYCSEMITKINHNFLEAGKLIGADYIISGSIQYTEQKIRIRINLLITATGELMMTKSIEKEVLTDVFDSQDEIIQTVICAIGGYYGHIFQEMTKASPSKVSKNIAVWKGIHNYYQYQRSYSVENYKLALFTLRLAVKKNPEHAVSWAMLGELYLNGEGLALKDVKKPVEEGYRCCMKALKIDPFCQQGWHTLTLYHLFKKEKEACLNAAGECIKLNPNCSVLVSGVALMVICAGYFDEGFPILDKAIKLHAYYPWWINCGFCFYYLHKEEYVKANYWANKIEAEETFWDPLLKATTLSYLNQDAPAKKQLTKLLKLEPEVPAKIENMLSTLLFSDELVHQIIKGLNKAGMQN